MEYKVTVHYSFTPSHTTEECEAEIQTPAFPSPSLTAYLILGIVSYLEISPRAKFFIYFL